MAWMLQRVCPPGLPTGQDFVCLEEPGVIQVELLAARQRGPSMLLVHVDSGRAERSAGFDLAADAAGGAPRAGAAYRNRACLARLFPAHLRDRGIAQDAIDHRRVVGRAVAAVEAEAVVDFCDLSFEIALASPLLEALGEQGHDLPLVAGFA